MAHVLGFTLDRHVVVQPHAVQQARKRWSNADELAQLTDHEVAKVIAEEVRAAVARGFVYDRKPKAFRFYGDRGTGITPWQRFVVGIEQEKGFVIALDSLPDVTVVTVVMRQGKKVRS